METKLFFFLSFIKQRIEPYFHRLSLLCVSSYWVDPGRWLSIHIQYLQQWIHPSFFSTHKLFPLSTPLFLFTSQFFRSPGQESWWHFPCPSKFYVFRRWWKEREREKGKGKERWKAMEVELFTFITNWKSEFVTWRNKKCHYLIFFPFFQLCAT